MHSSIHQRQGRKESNQSLQVLGGGGHQKLFAYVLQPPQAHTTQPDPIFQLTEERLNLPFATLMLEEEGSWVRRRARCITSSSIWITSCSYRSEVYSAFREHPRHFAAVALSIYIASDDGRLDADALQLPTFSHFCCPCRIRRPICRWDWA